jgi:hypothetical protein
MFNETFLRQDHSKAKLAIEDETARPIVKYKQRVDLLDTFRG